MAYYVVTTDVNCSIPKDNIFEAVRILASRYPTTTLTGDHPEDLCTLFDEIGFEDPCVGQAGEVNPGFYDGKYHNEGRDFCAIAHLISDGSSIEWRGENGFLYRWVFKEKELIEEYGSVVWNY